MPIPRPRWQVYAAALAYPLACLVFPVASLPTALYVSVALLIVYYAVSAFPGSSRFAFTLLCGDGDALIRPASTRERRTWFWLGFAFTVAVFILLEVRQPFYFTQDDGISQFLPVILQAMHSIEGGVFPTWNPYQYLGHPTTTVGTYALTYPPTYVSNWIARHLLGHEYATLDVFSILHLLAGYAVTFWAARREQVRPSLAMLAGLCCVLSGYALVVGRGWFYMSPVFVWVPAMIILLRSAIERPPDLKWVVTAGLVIGAYFHAGNVQMWAYTMLLFSFALLLLVVTRALPLRRLLAIAAGMSLGIAISTPLLVPEFLATRGISRSMIAGGMLKGLPTLFVPISVIHTMHPLGWGGPSRNVVGEMYYSGTLFCVVGALLLLVLIGFRWDRRTLSRNLWFPCAVLALIFALGPIGILWQLLWKVPGYSEFRTAFKFLGLFNIFMAIAGAAALERLLRRWRLGLRTEIAVSVIILALLAHHCTLCTGSFFVFGFRPYPPIEAGLQNLLLPHDNFEYPKLVSVAAWRSESPQYLNSLDHQWPTLFGFFAVGGYDPLVDSAPDYTKTQLRIITTRAEALRELGVRYFVVDRSALDVWNPEDGYTHIPILRGSSDLKTVYHSDQVTVFELPGSKPMAFEEAHPEQPLAVVFDGAGATIDTTSTQGNTIILNMLRRPEIRARVAGHTVPVESDTWTRIRIHIPSATKSVRVDFRPAWGLGFAAGAALLIFSLIMGGLYRRLQHLEEDGNEFGANDRDGVVEQEAGACPQAD